ncbi:MAG: TIGR01777 family protein [Bacteroidia bacterium]|nr:TIGR01777 family protein [Bacteroidia bacterium]
MKIFITGATGFVGSNLVNYLIDNGYDVSSITRKDLLGSAEDIALKIEGAYAVINLAGATINKRWTRKYKREIYTSRIFTTKKIVEAIGLCKTRPLILINASAIGIYDDIHVHDEQSHHLAFNYLSKVVRDWEHVANSAMDFGTQVFILRLGIVLGRNGGMLKKLIPLFKMGLGGKIGNGKQYFSFIHIKDILNVIDFALSKKLPTGVYNLTSPERLTNYDLIKQIARIVRKPAFFHLPKFFFSLLYKEGAIVLTGGQAAIPFNLMEHGYKFQFPVLFDALTEELKK